MYKDPIVEEVRSIRDEYARQFGYDLHAICEDLRKNREDSGRSVVRHSPKRLHPAREKSETPVRAK